MKTIVCGVDSSPGARAALRVAATLAEVMDARLLAVHVLDRLIGGAGSAERIADEILRRAAAAGGARAAALEIRPEGGSPVSAVTPVPTYPSRRARSRRARAVAGRADHRPSTSDG